MIKKINFWKLSTTILLTGLVLVLVYQVSYAWTNPTTNPPTGAGAITVSGGNVGIGTTNPLYKLDVVGDVNFTGILRQNGVAFSGSQWTTSGSTIYYNTGNVGIGTTAPGEKLDVGGNIRISGDSGLAFAKIGSIKMVRSIYDPTGTAASIDFYRGGNTAEGEIAFSVNSGATQGQLPTEQIRINKFGAVGFGTSSPDGNYRITTTAGGIKAENNSTTQPSGYFANAGGGPALVIGTGNVGIGTTAPMATLDVNGRIKALAPIDSNDVATKGYVDAASGVSWAGYTAATYNGNLGGIKGMNTKCNSYYAGSHACTVDEIIKLGLSYPYTANSWLINSNDLYPIPSNCYNWQSNATSYSGYVLTTVGAVSSSACYIYYSLGCCK